MSLSTLFSGLLFGGIGFVAFVYGKKMGEWRPLVIGIALMAYPFAVPDATLQWVIGAGLTAALFLFR